jgi:hypothetical protein
VIVDLKMDISTEIYHLQELPLYAREKPYTMRYVPEDGIAVSNVVREKHTVQVKDIRGHEDEYQLDTNGFTISKITNRMSYEDYGSHEKITDVYLPQLQKLLCEHFPGTIIDFVSYLVLLRRPFSKG